MLASIAGGGELRVTFPRNELSLRFERNEDDARDTQETRTRFNETFDIVGSEPELDGNVVYIWENTPTDEETALLDRCLVEG